MKASHAALAVASALGVLAVAASGCGTKSSHPPQLSSPGAATPDSPIECSELYAASDELRGHVPGALVYDGGPAECIVKGATCPLRDTDVGVCDGGHEAAIPGAQCEGTQWFGVCFDLDAGLSAADAGGDASDGGAP